MSQEENQHNFSELLDNVVEIVDDVLKYNIEVKEKRDQQNLEAERWGLHFDRDNLKNHIALINQIDSGVRHLDQHRREIELAELQHFVIPFEISVKDFLMILDETDMKAERKEHVMAELNRLM